MPRPPAGPDSPNYGIRGTRWRALRARILAESDVCHICGRPGADTVDHLIPRVLRPDLAMEVDNLRPAHGICNSAKGDRVTTTTVPSQAARARNVPMNGWDVGPGNCPFAGVVVKAGEWGDDRPTITYTHDIHCGQNHKLPW